MASVPPDKSTIVYFKKSSKLKSKKTSIHKKIKPDKQLDGRADKQNEPSSGDVAEQIAINDKIPPDDQRMTSIDSDKLSGDQIDNSTTQMKLQLNQVKSGDKTVNSIILNKLSDSEAISVMNKDKQSVDQKVFSPIQEKSPIYQTITTINQDKPSRGQMDASIRKKIQASDDTDSSHEDNPFNIQNDALKNQNKTSDNKIHHGKLPDEQKVTSTIQAKSLGDEINASINQGKPSVNKVDASTSKNKPEGNQKDIEIIQGKSPSRQTVAPNNQDKKNYKIFILINPLTKNNLHSNNGQNLGNDQKTTETTTSKVLSKDKDVKNKTEGSQKKDQALKSWQKNRHFTTDSSQSDQVVQIQNGYKGKKRSQKPKSNQLEKPKRYQNTSIKKKQHTGEQKVSQWLQNIDNDTNSSNNDESKNDQQTNDSEEQWKQFLTEIKSKVKNKKDQTINKNETVKVKNIKEPEKHQPSEMEFKKPKNNSDKNSKIQEDQQDRNGDINKTNKKTKKEKWHVKKINTRPLKKNEKKSKKNKRFKAVAKDINSDKSSVDITPAIDIEIIEMEQQQVMTQQDQNMSNPQLGQQQMMLCPVRLVYESPILMPSAGDQMQQNQAIFINPQNPPPWMRPVQNQVIYVQQLPNNIMPIQQTMDPNLYLQQNYVSYPQMMHQQILTQNPNEPIRLPLQMQNLMPGVVQNLQQNQVQVQQNLQQQIQAQNVQNTIQNIHAQNVQAQNAQTQNAQNQNVQDNQNQTNQNQNVQVNQSSQNTQNDTKPQMLVNYGQLQANIANSSNMQNLQPNQYIVNNRQMVMGNVIQNPAQNLNQNLVQNQLVQQQISNHLIATQKAQEMQKQTVYRNLAPQMNQTQIIARPQMPQMMGQMQNLQNVQNLQNIQQIGQTFVPSIRQNVPLQMQNIGQNVANVQQTFVNAIPNVQTVERHVAPNVDNKTSGGTVSYTAVRNGQTYTYRAIQPRPTQFRHLPNLLPMGAQQQSQGQVQAQTQTIVQTRPNFPNTNQVKQQNKPITSQATMAVSTTTQIKQEPNTSFNRKRKSESPDEVQKKIPANTTVYGNMTVTTKPPLNIPKPIMACNEIGVNTSPVHKIEDKLPVSQLNVLQLKSMDVQMNNVKQSHSQITQTDKKPDVTNMTISNANNTNNNMTNMMSAESNMARLLEKEKLIRNTVFTQARGRLLSDKNTQSTPTEQHVNKTSAGTNTEPNNKNIMNNSMNIDNNKSFGVTNSYVDQKPKNIVTNMMNTDQAIRNALAGNSNNEPIQVSRSVTLTNVSEVNNKNMTTYNNNTSLEQQSKGVSYGNISAEQYVKNVVFNINAEQNLRAFAASNAINEHNVRTFVQNNNINSEPMRHNISFNAPNESNAKTVTATETSPKKDEGVQTNLIPLKYIKTEKQDNSMTQKTEDGRLKMNDIEMKTVAPVKANVAPKINEQVAKINITEMKPNQTIKTENDAPKYSIKIEFSQKPEDTKKQEARVKAFELNKAVNDNQKPKSNEQLNKMHKPNERSNNTTPVTNDKTNLDKLSELTNRISEPETKLPKKEVKSELKIPKTENNAAEPSKKDVKIANKDMKQEIKPTEPMEEVPMTKSTVDSVNNELALKNRREYKNVSLNDTGEIHIVDGNIVKQDKEFILTHVLDGFVIQESNVPFAIRKPLKEKTLIINAPRSLDMLTECKQETTKDKTTKESTSTAAKSTATAAKSNTTAAKATATITKPTATVTKATASGSKAIATVTKASATVTRPTATVVKEIDVKENGIPKEAVDKKNLNKEFVINEDTSMVKDEIKEDKKQPDQSNSNSSSKDSKKIPDLSNLNLNEESKNTKKEDCTQESEDGANNGSENPFGGLVPNAVKAWTAEELASHLSKYNWSETIAILQEHEIDGESLFLASKPQLMTIGVSETHADLICEFVKS